MAAAKLSANARRYGRAYANNLLPRFTSDVDAVSAVQWEE